MAEATCAYLNSQGDNYASLNDKQQKVQIPCPTTDSKLHYHFLKIDFSFKWDLMF